MRRLLPLIALVVFPFGSFGSAWGQQGKPPAGSSASAPHPNYDARYHAPPSSVPLPPDAAGPPAFVASRDGLRGVPSFLFAPRPAPPSLRHGPRVTTPEQAARFYLARYAGRYGLTPAALSTALVTHVHDVGRGGIVVTLRQRVGGVSLFLSDVKVLLDRHLDLVAIAGGLHPAATPHVRAPFRTGPADALAAALTDVCGASVGPRDVRDLRRTEGDYRTFGLASTPAVRALGLRFVDRARVKKVYFPLPERIVPAWFVETLSERAGTAGSVATDHVYAADDGRLLFREDLTAHDVFDYRVFADASGDHRPADGPIADFTPHPTAMPDGSYPDYATPNLIAIDGFDKFGDPWLPPAATETTGNNVDAYTDDDKPDGFSGPPDLRATITSANTFDRTYDTTLGPQSSAGQKMAAVTDLFYVTNWLHDWWYDSGFDEAAGNAQKDNLGRGGVAGDPLHAEAQDGAPSTRNNSNMQTLSDGASPRMQMYVWDGKVTHSLHVQPLDQTLPTSVAGFGPLSFSVTDPVVLADDGSGTTTDACEALTGSIAGKIALVDRGTCSFKTKALHVQDAGGTGMILANNQANQPPPPLGNDPNVNATITIALLGITKEDGATLKTGLQSGTVTATMTRSTDPDVDGTIDNTVVSHEWGHYLHHRLVQCGSHTCGAESEGWADFTALQVMLRQGDDLGGTFAVGQYATRADTDPGYFGIRRYPYSVDFTKNALTFGDISDGQALPQGVAENPDVAGIANSEVHDAGEIWATMLFEGFVAMLQRSKAANPPYTFDQARRRMSDYVVGGMMMAPVDPTYTEQRDGILAAAFAADPKDGQLLAQAFARRGAGTCALSPPRDSTDLKGVTEDFSISSVVNLVSSHLDDSVHACNADGNLDRGETGLLTLKFMNGGTSAWSGKVTVSTTTSGVQFPNGPESTITIDPFAMGTVAVQVALDPAFPGKQVAAFHVDLAPTASCDPNASIDPAALVDFRAVPDAAATDDVEADTSTWKPDGTADDGTPPDQIWSRQEVTAGDHAWRGQDHGSPSDTALVSPPLQVSTTDPFVLTFDERHQFEASDPGNGEVYWDGGVVEISTDDGAHWEDVSQYGDPGYGGTIGDPTGQAKNVLAKRMGYVAQNASWPKRDTVKVDMGTKLAGKTVRVRFRVGTDDASGDFGWELDNVGFAGITNLPFTALVDDDVVCPPASQPDAGAADGGDDGGAAMDGGTELLSAGGGCACTVGRRARGPGGSLAMVALSALWLVRRRRRARGRA